MRPAQHQRRQRHSTIYALSNDVRLGWARSAEDLRGRLGRMKAARASRQQEIAPFVPETQALAVEIMRLSPPPIPVTYAFATVLTFGLGTGALLGGGWASGTAFCMLLLMWWLASLALDTRRAWNKHMERYNALHAAMRPALADIDMLNEKIAVAESQLASVEEALRQS